MTKAGPTCPEDKGVDVGLTTLLIKKRLVTKAYVCFSMSFCFAVIVHSCGCSCVCVSAVVYESKCEYMVHESILVSVRACLSKIMCVFACLYHVHICRVCVCV